MAGLMCLERVSTNSSSACLKEAFAPFCASCWMTLPVLQGSVLLLVLVVWSLFIIIYLKKINLSSVESVLVERPDYTESIFALHEQSCESMQ